MTAATTVDEVVARLDATDAALPPADGVGCFSRMYRTVTLLVRERLGDGYFADPAAMNALDVTFANVFIAALDAAAAGAPVPRAWEPLFARRADPRIESIQFALAGMNAHINHDLPVAVVATCAALGRTPDDLHGDYLAVNALLADVEGQVRRSYEDEVVRRADEDLSPVLDLVGAWSIEKARDAAWVNAGVLWHLRDVAFLRGPFEATLARHVGLATAFLLTPLR
jgi:hypothetical protein